MDKRAVLENLDWELDGIQIKGSRKEAIDRAPTALNKLEKEKMLEYVGEDRKLTQHYDGFDNGFDTGYNQAKDEFRKKVSGL